MGLEYRLIQKSDDEALAQVIRRALEEQGNNKEGTIYTDPLLLKMSSGYQTENSVYYVVIENGKLIGGCGIAPIPNQENNYCELQRMFINKEARGKGIGAELMRLCLDFAQKANYDLVYIETFGNMHEAIKLYERSGFVYTAAAMGNTGHFSCNVYMTKSLR